MVIECSIAIKNRNAFPNFYRLVTAFREHGHRLAQTDLLKLNNNQKEYVPELEESRYDMGSKFNPGGIVSWKSESLEVKDGIQLLRDTYANKVGFEFMYIEVWLNGSRSLKYSLFIINYWPLE